MAFRFEELRVWQDALRLCNEIDLLTHSFPKHELYSLSSQIKRAADSIVLNIAEGSTGQSIPEYKRFLRIALRSGIEVVACLFISVKRNYINQEIFEKYYSEYEVLSKMITKLINSMGPSNP
jgi:four helix bundle protein